MLGQLSADSLLDAQRHGQVSARKEKQQRRDEPDAQPPETNDNHKLWKIPENLKTARRVEVQRSVCSGVCSVV